MTEIKVGVRWPDYEVPIERVIVRDFVQAAEELGFDHITTFDHMAGMTTNTRRGWWSSYTADMQWAETLTLLSHMSGVSAKLGFMSAILCLPMRPAVLVAKQAATIDVMTEGRFRLGVGIGSNDIEFAMMGASFHDRADRMEEQIAVLRKLWTNQSMYFKGRYHTLPSVGLSLAPIQRPIPIWMAAGMEAPLKVLRRIGQLADGVIPEWGPDDRAREKMEIIREEARKAGRDPSAIGMEPKVALRADGGRQAGIAKGTLRDDDDMAAEIQAWKEFGVTHLEYKSRSCGLTTLDEHLREVTRFKKMADEILR